MRRIDNIGELAYELFVEVECPICNNIYISTMIQAETILVFGCINCGTIGTSDILSLHNITPFIQLIDYTDEEVLCHQEG